MVQWKSFKILKEVKKPSSKSLHVWAKNPMEIEIYCENFEIYIEISMENWLFILFLSKLQGPLSFYTSLENNTIFLHFSVSGRGWRILSPCRRQSYYFKMYVLKRRKLSFVLEWNKLFCDIKPIHWPKATFHKSTTHGRLQDFGSGGTF